MSRPLAWIFLTAALGLAGCGADNSIIPTVDPGPAATPLQTDNVPDNLTLVHGSLAILGDTLPVQVGDDAEDAKARFQSRQAAITVSAVPARFPNPPYSAAGWESGDGTAGFAVISLKGSVAAAFRRLLAASAEDATATVKKYQDAIDALGTRSGIRDPVRLSYGGGQYRYWFWDEDAGNRLMILWAPAKNDKIQLTIGLGDQTVMNALRASPDEAKLDMTKLMSSTSATGRN